MRKRNRRRRGVVLLVVLTLLVLFTLLAVTFAIVAGQYKTAARASSKIERAPGPDLLELGLKTLVRDTSDTRSVLRGHSLLLDLYGLDGFTGELSAVSSTSGAIATGTGNQFFELQFDSTSLKGTDGGSFSLNSTPGFYNGCVLTPVNGDASGASMRIVSYTSASVFRVMTGRTDARSNRPKVGDRVVVNGRPFNGTGFGYETDSSAGRYTKLNVSAIRPNRRGEATAQFADFVAGGADESYDAVDFQNLALAALIPDRSNSPSSHNQLAYVIPSFHRPAMVNYWTSLASGQAGSQAYWNARRNSVIFRPMAWNNPNFTGGNLELTFGLDGEPGVAGTDDDGNGITDRLADGTPDKNEFGYIGSDDLKPLVDGPWDIDNDGDGVNDSVWLDINAPLQQMRDGRLVKPLYAMLCIDLDGRVNLNAHGNLTHIARSTSGITDAANLARGQQANSLREGQGYGPAEVYLGGILGNGLVAAPSRNAYDRLLRGDVQRQIRGRYGDNQVPGVNGFDLMAEVKFFEFPVNYFNSAYHTSFHSPPDLFGELAFGLDHRGQLQYDRPKRADVLSNSPYETNLVDPGARGDRPFTLEELERLLRYNDADSDALADRLTTLVGEFDRSLLSQNNRRLVTTDSFSLPVPPVLARDLQTSKAEYINGTYASAFPKDRPLHLTDLLALRLAKNGLSGASLSSELAKMIAPDLANGVRFDINRPFGNGRDSNSNRVVDEHGPQPSQQLEAAAGVDRIWSQNVDHDNDGDTSAGDTDAHLARQLFARHLYVLAMMVKSPNVNIDFDGDGTKSSSETARGLAQWAINVVDFRDADSIMTPFEYDTNPFDGWSLDGDIATNEWGSDGIDNDGDSVIDEPDERSPVVWGCERPELLITETLAFHDERTQPDADMDGNNDQRLRPRGSFFVELYNPWSNDERLPAEFYFDHPSGGWQAGVMLNKLSPSGGAPVWRIAVEDGGTVDGTVYMASTTGPVLGRTYSTTLPVGLLRPGKYAVVGSVGQQVDSTGKLIDLDSDGIKDKLTTIGRLEAASEGGLLDYANTRSIVLEPSTNTTVQQVTILNNGTVEPNLNQIQPAIAVAINKVWDPVGGVSINESLNISQPRSSYPSYPATGPNGELWDPNLADFEGAYTPPIPEPLSRDIPTSAVVHLQRLANPLLPFDAVSNPYLTIDQMPVEVDEFNGIDKTLDTFRTSVDSFERGESEAAPATNRSLWSADATASRNGGAGTAESNGPHELPYQLKHSLGYLSKKYAPMAANRFARGDVVGTTAIPDKYIGAPNSNSGNPFPWLTWNNRPYVSQYEMMLVPVNSPDQLTSEISLYSGGNPYRSTAHFSQLLNFFDGTGRQGASAVTAPDLYRLFEYTGVPSRFVGTETWLNPSVFASGYGTDYLHPPFNRISRFRDPGKININTVFDDRIWEALRGKNGSSLGASFDEWIASRRGYPGSRIVTPDANFPTLFSNPLRSSDTGQLVPVDEMERVGVECSLLRSRMVLGTADGSTPSQYEVRSTDDDPIFGDDLGGAHNNPDRSAYFRYLSLMRMGNLVTSQSNVYATWITVGYFEVDPATGELGQEYGIETGRVKRNRGFYVIDRSIPVAFEPGQNHNIQQAIRLRRVIE